MKDEVGKLLDRIRKNNGSAFTIVEFVLDDLLAMAATGRMSRERWKELALGLAEAKGRMAPLYNIANLILLNAEKEDFNSSISSVLDKTHRMHTDSVEKIADAFVSSHRPKRVMVNSYSATVLECLVRLAKKGDLVVTVTESLPMGEGVMFAEALANRKIETEIISDSMVFEWMRKTDMFLSGADAILPDRIFNKMGSRCIASAAKAEGKAVVVVCDSLKLIPVEVGDSASKTMVIGPRLKRCSTLFESFDASMADMVITEAGQCKGSELKERFRSWSYSPLLKKGN